jgi:hypothetical protein
VAMFLTYTGLLPLDELTPPTRLNPRLSDPLRVRVISSSEGLHRGELN